MSDPSPASQCIGNLSPSELIPFAIRLRAKTKDKCQIFRPPELGGYFVLKTPSGNVALDPFLTEAQVISCALRSIVESSPHVTVPGTQSIDLEGCASLIAR